MEGLNKIEDQIYKQSNVRVIEKLTSQFFDEYCKTLHSNDFTKGEVLMFGDEDFCKDFKRLLSEMNAGGVSYDGVFKEHASPLSLVVEVSCSRGSYNFNLIPRYDLKDVSIMTPLTEVINYNMSMNIYYERT